MTSIGIRHESVETRPSRSSWVLQQVLLIAGILSSVLYVSFDQIAAARYPDYSLRDQVISELSATGAPTAGFWSAMGPFYGILIVGFVIGVIRGAGSNRALRTTGWLILAFVGTGLLWPFFPMHQRGGEFNWQDVGHIIVSALSVVLILSFIGKGARAFGRRFRVYSTASFITFFITAALTFALSPRIAAGEPTPWIGFVERVMIYDYLLWIAVLAVMLLRQGNPGGTR